MEEVLHQNQYESREPSDRLVHERDSDPTVIDLWTAHCEAVTSMGNKKDEVVGTLDRKDDRPASSRNPTNIPCEIDTLINESQNAHGVLGRSWYCLITATTMTASTSQLGITVGGVNSGMSACHA